MTGWMMDSALNVSADNPGWFVRAEYQSSSADAPEQPVKLPQSCFDPQRAMVTFDLTSHVRDDDLPGHVTLWVRATTTPPGGQALIYTNVILMPLGSMRRNASTGQLTERETLSHEIGHMLGLVPNRGNDNVSDLDPLPNGYSLSGSHCHLGLPLQASYSAEDQQRAQCLMFGNARTTTVFCPDCVGAIRKQDLSEGWEPVRPGVQRSGRIRGRPV